MIWQVLLSVLMGGLLVVSGAALGAYAVFRTRHAQTDIPFIRHGRKEKDNQPASYVSDLFPAEEMPKEEKLSEAAQRLHEQKDSTAARMSMIRGGK